MYADIDSNRYRLRWTYKESQRCSYIEREMDIDMNEKTLVCLSNRDILDEENMAPPEPEVPIYRERERDIDMSRDRYR